MSCSVERSLPGWGRRQEEPPHSCHTTLPLWKVVLATSTSTLPASHPSSSSTLQETLPLSPPPSVLARYTMSQSLSTCTRYRCR